MVRISLEVSGSEVSIETEGYGTIVDGDKAAADLIYKAINASNIRPQFVMIELNKLFEKEKEK